MFGAAWGDGEPTVLALHGWQRTHRDFAPVFAPDGPIAGAQDPAMGAAPTAVALDLFGFGSTPAPPEPWGSGEYASHLLPLFEQPGALAERVVLVGHSFGGGVALHLATMVPDRIERLVLTGVPLFRGQGGRARPAMAYRVVRRLRRMGLVGEDRLEGMRARFGSPDYRAAQGVMRPVLVRVLAETYVEQMAAVACPVDLVWGEDDGEVPLEVATRAQGLFPTARLVSLPGVGHLTPTEAPGALRAVITGGERVAGEDSTAGQDSASGEGSR